MAGSPVDAAMGQARAQVPGGSSDGPEAAVGSMRPPGQIAPMSALGHALRTMSAGPSVPTRRSPPSPSDSPSSSSFESEGGSDDGKGSARRRR